MAESDCVNIRKLGKFTAAVAVERGRGGVFFFFVTLRVHDVPLEMLMKSDKLQNYIPREMCCFFFFLSCRWRAREGLDFGERGARDGMLQRDARVFPFSNRFIPFPPGPQYAGQPAGVFKLQGNTPRAPTLIYSNLPPPRYLKFLLPSALLLFNNE